jgi:hypothetical protein
VIEVKKTTCFAKETKVQSNVKEHLKILLVVKKKIVNWCAGKVVPEYLRRLRGLVASSSKKRAWYHMKQCCLAPEKKLN